MARGSGPGRMGDTRIGAEGPRHWMWHGSELAARGSGWVARRLHSDDNVSMHRVLSVLAKAKGEMSCGHRDSPKFQLLRRILDKAWKRHEVEERAGSLLEQMLL